MSTENKKNVIFMCYKDVKFNNIECTYVKEKQHPAKFL